MGPSTLQNDVAHPCGLTVARSRLFDQMVLIGAIWQRQTLDLRFRGFCAGNARLMFQPTSLFAGPGQDDAGYLIILAGTIADESPLRPDDPKAQAFLIANPARATGHLVCLRIPGLFAGPEIGDLPEPVRQALGAALEGIGVEA